MNEGHLTASVTAMMGGVTEMSEFSCLHSAKPNAAFGHELTIFPHTRRFTRRRRLAQGLILLSALSTKDPLEFPPLLILEHRDHGVIPKLVSEECPHRRATLRSRPNPKTNSGRRASMPCMGAHAVNKAFNHVPPNSDRASLEVRLGIPWQGMSLASNCLIFLWSQ